MFLITYIKVSDKHKVIFERSPPHRLSIVKSGKNQGFSKHLQNVKFSSTILVACLHQYNGIASCILDIICSPVNS